MQWGAKQMKPMMKAPKTYQPKVQTTAFNIEFRATNAPQMMIVVRPPMKSAMSPIIVQPNTTPSLENVTKSIDFSGKILFFRTKK